MYIKILMTLVFMVSLIFIVRYFTAAPDIIKSNDGGNTVTEFPSVKELEHIPGTFLSKNGQLLSDEPLLQNNQTEELEINFFKNTNNTDNFGVYYYKESGNLTVMLYNEDTKTARIDAEEYVKDLLPYTETELCNIDAVVMTNEYVNPALSGINLGFSFCPDNVPL